MTNYEAPLPFPQVKIKEELRKRNEKQRLEFLELFKKVNVNLPLLDIVNKIPSYAKFLKEVCTKKKRFKNYEQVALCEEVSAIIQKRLPPKMKDPGSFTIPCTIGECSFDKALMDLGASVNIMPLSVFEKLGVGVLKPTNISLQLADKSVKRPKGIIEDVLVKVDKLILPVDFIVLEMVEGDPENASPLIFGRPFMATAGTKINVKKGTLKMKVLDQSVEFQVFKPLLDPDDELLECFYVEGTKESHEDSVNKEEPHMLPSPLESKANSLEELPFFEDYVKQNPQTSETKKEEIMTSKKVVGKGKKKKKTKRYPWPPRLTPKFLIPSDCFGVGGCGKRSTAVSGKKECFEPP
jgi:hypothetical protein